MIRAGVRLQRAGIEFISCRARHFRGHILIEELVCPTAEALAKATTWAEKEGFPIVARLATEEEMEAFRKRQEIL
jgi:hypothetical protein